MQEAKFIFQFWKTLKPGCVEAYCGKKHSYRIRDKIESRSKSRHQFDVFQNIPQQKACHEKLYLLKMFAIVIFRKLFIRGFHDKPKHWMRFLCQWTLYSMMLRNFIAYLLLSVILVDRNKGKRWLDVCEMFNDSELELT